MFQLIFYFFHFANTVFMYIQQVLSFLLKNKSIKKIQNQKCPHLNVKFC